ncbi:MAG: PAS domain-containing protein [Acidobacteria bacterium]|nr:PAS domain-containing protein [Acidobacteriota bacterium]
MGRTSQRDVPDLLEQLSHTGDGVFAIDTRHRIILWNHAAEALLGYQVHEVLGKYCNEIIRGRDSSGNQVCGAWCSEFQQVTRNRWPHHKKIRTYTRDVREIWIDVSTLAVLSPRQELSSLVHIFREVGHPITFSVSPVEAPAKSANRDRTRRIEPSIPALLSRQEHIILRLLAEGCSTKSIADRLCISVVTVRNHIQSILQKLDVHSRLEAVALASRRNLIQTLGSPPIDPLTSITTIRQ